MAITDKFPSLEEVCSVLNVLTQTLKVGRFANVCRKPRALMSRSSFPLL